MFTIFGKEKELEHMMDPVDMGINRVVEGITDMETVINACHEEIVRRILRYENEVLNGMEEPETVLTSRDILARFDRIYQENTKL
jgi:uncharacterized protein (UPF0371 family)